MAAQETYSYKPHSMACIVNMYISVPHSTAKEVNAYCNNGQSASKHIVFGYSWMPTSVPNGPVMRCPTSWTQQQLVPLMKSFRHYLVLAMYYSGMLHILPWSLKQHVPCQQLYLRKHGLLQQMKCLLKKQQIYTGHIMTPTLINAWKSYLSGHQQCKSPPYNWKISQLFKFPNKYSGKISETCI